MTIVRCRLSALTPLIALMLWCAAPLAATAQAPDQAYEAAYLRWQKAVEAHPELGVPFWVSADDGPPDLREAVSGLASFGPNLVPFLVQQMRAESDQLRLYRLILLLNRVSGIDLYYAINQNIYAAVPQLRAEFLAAWDTGRYANATVLLQKEWKEPDPGDRVRRVDPKSITALRRYGVYAVPFIAEQLRDHNSPELFAAFLIITDERALYSEYIEDPARRFSNRSDKMSVVREWARRNEQKIDRLKELHVQIRSLAAR